MLLAILLAFCGVSHTQRVRPTVNTAVACKTTATFTSTVLSTVTNVIVTSRCPRPDAQTIGSVVPSTVSNACASVTIFTTSTVTSKICQKSSMTTSTSTVSSSSSTAISGTTSSSSSVSPAPTIGNAGFEDYGDYRKTPMEWTLSGTSTPASDGIQRAHTGVYALKMVLRSANDVASLSQVISGLSPSTQCQIQFWLIQMDVVSPASGQSKITYGGSTYSPFNGFWRQFSYTQSTDALGQLLIKIDGRVDGFSGSNYYLDDFTYTCNP